MARRSFIKTADFILDAAEWRLDSLGESSLTLSARGWQQVCVSYAEHRRADKSIEQYRSTGYPNGGKSVSLRNVVAALNYLGREGHILVEGRTSDYDVNVYTYVREDEEGGCTAIVDGGPGTGPEPDIIWF